MIAAPCSIPWESMEGDERQRNCSGCSRIVYNISDMTRTEAEDFLRANGTSQCMRFFRRQDGTIMTDDCPRALRKIRDRWMKFTRTASSFVALFLSWQSAFAQQTDKPQEQNQNANSQQCEKTDSNKSKRSQVERLIPGTNKKSPFQGPIMGLPRFRPQAVGSDDALTKIVNLPTGAKYVLNFSLNGTYLDSKFVPLEDQDAPKTPNISTTCMALYGKAEQAIRQKKCSEADAYLTQAIEEFDKQKVKGDPFFRDFLVGEQTKLRSNSKMENDTKR